MDEQQRVVGVGVDATTSQESETRRRRWSSRRKVLEVVTEPGPGRGKATPPPQERTKTQGSEAAREQTPGQLDLNPGDVPSTVAGQVMCQPCAKRRRRR